MINNETNSEVTYTPDDLRKAAIENNLEFLNAYIQHHLADLAILNDAGPKGVTALYFATSNGHTEFVRILLNHNVSVNGLIDNEYSIINTAAILEHFDIVELLLDKNADISPSKQGLTPLFSAIEHNKTQLVEKLLVRGANSNQITSSGNFPLLEAIDSKNKDIILLLLNHHADINQTLNEISPIIRAIMVGDYEIIKLLLNYKPILNQENSDKLPILFAIYSQRLDILQLLVENGADLNLLIPGKATPFTMALTLKNKAILQYLFTKKVEVNVTLSKGISPLMQAVELGKNSITSFLPADEANLFTAMASSSTHSVEMLTPIEIITWLLDHGAKINHTNDTGNTALHIAAVTGQSDIVKLLIEKNADLQLKAKDGLTLIQYAVIGGLKELVEFLLNSNWDVNITTSNRRTLLYLAVEYGHKDLVVFLQGKGLTLDCLPKSKIPLLCIAVRNNHLTVVDYLLNQGVNIHQADKDGLKPLHIACFEGHYDIAVKLLDHQAHLSPSAEFWSPACFATFNNQEKIIALLITRGVDMNQMSKGITPLYCAIKVGNINIVNQLLNKGVDLKIVCHLPNQNAVSALEFAKSCKKPAIVQLINDALSKPKIPEIYHRMLFPPAPDASTSSSTSTSASPSMGPGRQK